MQPLPPGWSITNNAGSFAGPVPFDSDSETAENDEAESVEDIQPDSPGWEDVDPDADVESVQIVCLLCASTFASGKDMLEHCKGEHGFDFLEVRKLCGLDFYGTIKFINYIRSVIQDRGAEGLNVSDPAAWADERFMQPVLSDDALLFSLDELIEFGKEGNVEDVEEAEAIDGMEAEGSKQDGEP